VLNRDLEAPMLLEGRIRGFGAARVACALTMHDADLEAVNSSAAPDRIRPVPLDGVGISGDHLRATLQPASWSMITLATDAS
jgi:alpha-L-arabinofuranosidase